MIIWFINWKLVICIYLFYNLTALTILFVECNNERHIYIYIYHNFRFYSNYIFSYIFYKVIKLARYRTNIKSLPVINKRNENLRNVLMACQTKYELSGLNSKLWWNMFDQKVVIGGLLFRYQVFSILDHLAKDKKQTSIWYTVIAIYSIQVIEMFLDVSEINVHMYV